MKFTFNIIKSFSARHTVEAENLMEAESKMYEIYWHIENYGFHDSKIKLVKITND